MGDVMVQGVGFVLWTLVVALSFYGLGKAVAQHNDRRQKDEFRTLNRRRRIF